MLDHLWLANEMFRDAQGRRCWLSDAEALADEHRARACANVALRDAASDDSMAEMIRAAYRRHCAADAFARGERMYPLPRRIREDAR